MGLVSATDVGQLAGDHLKLYCQSLHVSMLNTSAVSSPNRWQPPRHGLLKLNCDAAMSLDQSSSGYGAIIWDSEGCVFLFDAKKGQPNIWYKKKDP